MNVYDMVMQYVLYNHIFGAGQTDLMNLRQHVTLPWHDLYFELPEQMIA